MENEIVDSSPVVKRHPSVDKQENAMTESLLHGSSPKTDEDVAIYDAVEGPRSRTSSSHKSSSSGISSFSGRISSPSSGGSNQSSSMSSCSLNPHARVYTPRLNPHAREYIPQRFVHSKQELRSGISNLSGTQIQSGGSSGGLLPVIPNPHMQSPLPSSPSNNFYRPLLESSPSPSPRTMAPPQPPFLGRATPESTPHRPTTSSAESKSHVARDLPSESFKTKSFPDESIIDVSKDLASISVQSPVPSPSPSPSTMAPPQPSFLGRATPQSTPHRPTTSSAESKSPVARNLPSESFKTKPFPDESITDVSKNSASISIRSPLRGDWVPLDDGIDCTLPPDLARSVLLSAGSTHKGVLSTLTSGSTQNDCSMTSGSTDQSRTLSKEELDDCMNRVLHGMWKRPSAFEEIIRLSNFPGYNE